jgi:hypothetical protein
MIFAFHEERDSRASCSPALVAGPAGLAELPAQLLTVVLGHAPAPRLAGAAAATIAWTIRATVAAGTIARRPTLGAPLTQVATQSLAFARIHSAPGRLRRRRACQRQRHRSDRRREQATNEQATTGRARQRLIGSMNEVRHATILVTAAAHSESNSGKRCNNR